MTTATPTTTATGSYNPTIKIVDLTGGLFHVQSESDWLVDYTVTLHEDPTHDTCTCKAGQAGRLCKHVRLCRGIWRASIKSLQMVNHQSRPWVIRRQPAATTTASAAA